MAEWFKTAFGDGMALMYLKALLVTLKITLIGTGIAYIVGIPLGIILYGTAEGSIFENKILNAVIGVIINILRSVPFIILLVLIQPIAKTIVGTQIGDNAFIFYLSVASAPFVARMVESSLKEVDIGVIEAARSMGSNNFQIIFKVVIPEAKPSLLVGAAIAITTILSYTPLTYLVGGSGLGQMAIQYGIYRFDSNIMYIASILLVIVVQAMQEVLGGIARSTDKRRKNT